MAVDSTSLIDGRVSVDQCNKAVSALLRHVRDEQQKMDETELLPGKEQHVWLVMTVKRMQPMKSLKPQRIVIEHPLVDPRTTSICLITKDPQREYKDLLESQNIKFISRVVGIEKLKGKFKGFDARRLLLHENGLFLADKRVLPLLPPLLGKEWFKAKKQPIPVTLTKKDLKGELEKAISSTYMHQNKGTCTSIKIATISQKDSQVVSNLKAAIPAVIARIHGGWDNVQSFNIKTSSSVSLPIWTCPLGGDDPGSRWEGMTVDEGEWGGFNNDGSDEAGQTVDHAEPVRVQETSPQSTRRKRTASPEEEVNVGVTKKKTKKNRTSTVSDMTISKPSNVPDAKQKLSKKSREPVDPDETASNKYLHDGSTVPSAQSEPLSAVSTDHLVSTKNARRSASEHHSSLPMSSAKPVPLKSNSGQVSPKNGLKETITRGEMKQKKVTFGVANMEKKKRKLHETEKSARKGVKAKLVGKLKA